jgi:hypothetical protein
MFSILGFDCQTLSWAFMSGLVHILSKTSLGVSEVRISFNCDSVSVKKYLLKEFIDQVKYIFMKMVLVT